MNTLDSHDAETKARLRLPEDAELEIDDDGPWDTECGQLFEFTYDGPDKNDFKFCPFCGGSLDIRKVQPVTED